MAAVMLVQGVGRGGNALGVSSAAATPTVQTAQPTTAPVAPSGSAATADASSIDPKAVENGDLSKDEYPEVPLDKSVSIDGGIVISLGQLQSQDLASAPGEIGGPSVGSGRSKGRRRARLSPITIIPLCCGRRLRRTSVLSALAWRDRQPRP